MESLYFYTGYVLSLLNFTTINWILRCMSLFSTDFAKAKFNSIINIKTTFFKKHPVIASSLKKYIFLWPMLYQASQKSDKETETQTLI